jgi:DNA primase catalytic core
MAFPSGFLDEIKARLPVSVVVGRKVRLTKAGKEWRGLSPFSSEKSPSFFVNDVKQRWFDFSAGRNGDVFAFVMESQGVEFVEAVRLLAAEAGLQLPEMTPEARVQEQRRRDIGATLAAAHAIYREGLRGSPEATAWLAGRGVAPDMVEVFELGFAPADGRAFLRAMAADGFDHDALIAAGLMATPEGERAPYARFRERIMFPIHDGAGRLVSFGGRALAPDDKTPKYLNGPESEAFDKGATLYNLHRARPAAHKTGRLALVEGYLDVVLMTQAGFADVVAPLGTAITEAHLETAWRAAPEPIVLLDGDRAGEKAALRLVELAWPRLEAARSLVFAAIGRGRDPADIVVRAAGLARRWLRRAGGEGDPDALDKVARAWGLRVLERIAASGKPFVEMAWEQLLAEAGSLDRPERKARLAKLVRERLEAIDDADAAEAYRAEFNARLKAAKVPAHLKLIEGGKGKAGAKAGKPKRERDRPVSDDGAGDEAGKVAAASWGYDTGKLNTEWALVLIGSKAVVVREQPKSPVEDRLRILSLDAFRAKYMNKVTQVLGSDGKLKTLSWADRWLRDRERRSFDGIEFHPDPQNAAGSPGYLNLWRGFSVTPDAKAGSYAIFRDHVLTNICGGDARRFTWLWGWFAHLVQRPRERIGTAVVLRGKMGTGKTKAGEVVGSLIEDHYFPVDEPRYITGQFNAHMASCLLLQAEEAVWAGDKAAEGRLKSLITSSMQMIEAKGIDPVRIRNYVRLMMTSNDDWVVPAGMDERRFAVFDVGDHAKENFGYFAEMDAELAAGGRQALLADLLSFDLASVELRQIPKTDALLEQKIRSLPSVESWWFGRLNSGSTTAKASTWLEEVPKATLVDDYIETSERIGVRRKAAETELALKLAKMIPGLREQRKFIDFSSGDTRRAWVWLMPPLPECRAAFEAALQQHVGWSHIDDDERAGAKG